MRFVSADSAAAMLDDNFKPILLVASVAVFVEAPYREAHIRLAEPVFRDAEEIQEVIVHEAELCLRLLEKVQADTVHLDATFGGVSVEELSPFNVANMRVSTKAKQRLIAMLPKLRKTAAEIQRRYGIDMLAIGKESIPVRIAELTAGAEAVLFAGSKAIEQEKSILLGLPTKCALHIAEDRVCLQSLISAEHDVRGYAQDAKDVLQGVFISEFPNPAARGFRALRIVPKT